MFVKRIMNDNGGSIIISVILGLGLAAMFRKACQGNSCLVIKAPSPRDVDDKIFRLDSHCYKYSPEVIPCPLSAGPAAEQPALAEL